MTKNEKFQADYIGFKYDLWIERVRVTQTNECYLYCIDPTDDHGLGDFKLKCQYEQLFEICTLSMGACDSLQTALLNAVKQHRGSTITIDLPLLYFGALYINHLEITVRGVDGNMNSIASSFLPDFIIESYNVVEDENSELRHRNRIYGQIIAIDHNLSRRYQEYILLIDREMNTEKARIITDLESDELFDLAILHYNHKVSRLRMREHAGLFVPIS